MDNNTERADIDHSAEAQHGASIAGWHEKAVHQRKGQQRAYHSEEYQDLVKRVISKVSSL